MVLDDVTFVYTRHTSSCMCVGFPIRLIPEPYPFGAAAYRVQICSRQICRSPQSLTYVSSWGLLRDILSLTGGQPSVGQIRSRRICHCVAVFLQLALFRV
ncbi:hypothetical protein GA0061070_1001132 [Kosakonia oryziphila]|uniref:Uncharacterized protein n=1 Tax=Kosakonia oryziphila TaxID=1005667 RepID=A0A1C3Z2H0_9ENTR|nr:hypothetical protein GA0061070_1001132 [Kosakonia oryziphila]